MHIFLRVTRMCQHALVRVFHSHLGVSRAEIIGVHADGRQHFGGTRLECMHIFLCVTCTGVHALVSVLHSHLGVSRAEVIRVHAD